jgi:hypothetical protein
MATGVGYRNKEEIDEEWLPSNSASAGSSSKPNKSPGYTAGAHADLSPPPATSTIASSIMGSLAGNHRNGMERDIVGSAGTSQDGTVYCAYCETMSAPVISVGEDERDRILHRMLPERGARRASLDVEFDAACSTPYCGVTANACDNAFDECLKDTTDGNT